MGGTTAAKRGWGTERGRNMRSDGERERAQRKRKQEGEREPSAEKVLGRLKAQSEGLLRPSG